MANLLDLYETTITELQDGLDNNTFTSVDLVKAYFARIAEVNHEGPKLNAVIETNPSALSQAAELDAERKSKGKRGILHGIPILVKDNIATLHSEGMNTTAGSYALLGSVVPRDAHVASLLRTAGAILIGKANLSEWANFRGRNPSGFSGRGGQCTSAYIPQGDPSGSSSGTAVGVSIGLAAGGLGTETDGSIIRPSSVNNGVGMKPTIGLTSRAGVIPISSHQDSVGPMTRCVMDTAILLNAIAGKDARDEATLAQPDILPDYTRGLTPDALKGARLGVPRYLQIAKDRDTDDDINKAFNAAIPILQDLGAEIIDNTELPSGRELKESKSEELVLSTDFKVDVKKYLDELVEIPTGVKNLADLIKFNIDHADQELVPPYWESQSRFIASEATVMDETYYAAVASGKDLGATRGIDAVLQKFDLDALIVPSEGFASGPPAVAGYPIITVPLGFKPSTAKASEADPTVKTAPGMPFGLSFIGTAWSEDKLLAYAYAFEQKTQARLKKKAFEAAIPKTQLADVMHKN